MSYYSQCGEDRWISENFRLPDFGTYCEVGAHNGETGSNTLYFEEKGWHGVLIEPVPELAAQCRHRRKGLVWCCAVGGPSGVRSVSKFVLNPDDLGASGFKRRGQIMPVIIQPLEALLTASMVDKLDVLSVDTEGSEVEVLLTLGTFRPKIIIAEYQTFDEPPNDAPLKELLEPMGYREVHKTQYNLIFEYERDGLLPAAA